MELSSKCSLVPLAHKRPVLHDQITKKGIGLQYGLLAHAPDEDLFLLVTHSSLQRFVMWDHTTKGCIESQYWTNWDASKHFRNFWN